jgi:NAD(P)-dependent dehydrogenase (short-subunit alcohol dehydrogenase family)
MADPLATLARRFPGRRVLITGGASGLGLALARELHGAGWAVGLLDRDAERLAAVKTELGERVVTATVDVCDDAALTRAVRDCVASLGGLEISIHCAGVVSVGPFAATTAEDWRWIMEINLHGVVSATRAVVPILMQAQRGLIINIASAASFCTGTGMSAYNTSKAAVVGFSESLMQELAPAGIQVLVAMPGFFRTRLLDAARGPDRTLASARRIMEQSNLEAGVVAHGLLAAAAAGRNYFITPRLFRRLWWRKRLAPERFQRWHPVHGPRARRP